MKILTKLALVAALATSGLAAGFGSNSNQTVKKLTGTDGKQYEYLIGTASNTGSYYKAGKRLEYMLPKKSARAETTDGSKQNLDLLEDGIINVAFAQGDIIAYRKATEPNFFKGKLVIKLDREESVQLIMRKGMDEDDLQDKGSKVLVGLANSGGAGSWSNIVKLEPEYGNASVSFGDVDDSALQDLEDKTIDGIIRTSYLNPDSDTLAMDVAKNKNLYFADLDDKDLNDSIDLGNGSQPIYKFEKVVVDSHGWDTKAKVLTTNVYIIIDKEALTKKQLNKIIRVVKNNKLF